MTSVNVTTQSNTVTVQQGDATTVTIATQGPQGPAGSGSSITINNNGTSKVITGSGTANTLNANTNLTFDGTTLNVKNGDGVINAGQGTFNGTVDLSSAESNSSNTAQFKLSNLTIGQHNNTGSYRFANAGTGSFLFTADNINFFNKDVNKNFLRLSASGVELYHDNVKRAETSANGLDLPDNSKLQLGNSQDLQIYHDSIASYIADTGQGVLKLLTDGFRVRNGADNENIIKADQNGGVELYHNNVKKAETSLTGFDIPEDFIAGSGSKLTVGASGDLTFFHDSANSYIQNNTGDLILGDTNHQYFRGNTSDKSVSLYFNGSEKIKTSADGLNLPDNSKLQLGDSQDLKIFHDGSQSVIKDSGTGQLLISGENTIALTNASGTENYARFINNGAVELYHNNIKKLETTNSGITVTGSVTTQDMNMSNLNGTANEVDNTKGSWSIQEGADDLFLINRVSGKKYKFNLTEV
tara:strand:+ start:896 stop:2305 length:1410 start_codon:yes stop_codon:yes gene_type:complete